MDVHKCTDAEQPISVSVRHLRSKTGGDQWIFNMPLHRNSPPRRSVIDGNDSIESWSNLVFLIIFIIGWRKRLWLALLCRSFQRCFCTNFKIFFFVLIRSSIIIFLNCISPFVFLIRRTCIWLILRFIFVCPFINLGMINLFDDAKVWWCGTRFGRQYFHMLYLWFSSNKFFFFSSSFDPSSFFFMCNEYCVKFDALVSKECFSYSFRHWSRLAIVIERLVAVRPPAGAGMHQIQILLQFFRRFRRGLGSRLRLKNFEISIFQFNIISDRSD